MLFAESTKREVGPFRLASVAGPPSPEYANVPLPAMVEIIPAGVIFRIREFPSSPNSKLPAPSNTIVEGELIIAEAAGPPSPLNPHIVVPAYLTIIPLELILRIWQLPLSVTYKFPLASIATELSWSIPAAVAGFPLPA